jgi:hypothetical protein
MKAEDFALKLKINSPSVVDYINNGYNEKLAIKTVNTFNIKKKKEKSNFNDELLELVDCYTTKNFEVATVNFYENIVERSDFVIVGTVEADWLIVDKSTGFIKVIELYSEISLWDCAVNGGKFLDAILEAKLYIMKSSLGDKLLRNKFDCFVAEECGRFAGGDQFIEFYKMLLGCFE